MRISLDYLRVSVEVSVQPCAGVLISSPVNSELLGDRPDFVAERKQRPVTQVGTVLLVDMVHQAGKPYQLTILKSMNNYRVTKESRVREFRGKYSMMMHHTSTGISMFGKGGSRPFGGEMGKRQLAGVTMWLFKKSRRTGPHVWI
jgi:hypothetical protein